MKFTVERFRVPLIGNALQQGIVQGYYPDDWMTDNFQGVFQVVGALSKVVARFYIPGHASFPMDMTFSVNDISVKETFFEPGTHELSCNLTLHPAAECNVSLHSTRTISGRRAGSKCGRARSLGAARISCVSLIALDR